MAHLPPTAATVAVRSCISRHQLCSHSVAAPDRRPRPCTSAVAATAVLMSAASVVAAVRWGSLVAGAAGPRRRVSPRCDDTTASRAARVAAGIGQLEVASWKVLMCWVYAGPGRKSIRGYSGRGARGGSVQHVVVVCKMLHMYLVGPWERRSAYVPVDGHPGRVQPQAQAAGAARQLAGPAAARGGVSSSILSARASSPGANVPCPGVGSRHGWGAAVIWDRREWAVCWACVAAGRLEPGREAGKAGGGP